jgi:hypothetical protein
MTNKNIFETKEQYLQMIEAWKETFKNSRPLERNKYGNKIRKLTDTDFFIYALLRGKDPRKCYHSEDRFCEALTDFGWLVKNPKYLESYRDGYGETITVDHILKSWSMYIQEQEVVNG